MDDIALLANKARQGDTEAFAKLYSLVYLDMYRTALYNLRSEHDACDAVSEAVMDAYASIGKLKSEAAFKSWIMKILFAKIKKKQKEYFSSGYEMPDEESQGFDFENSDLREAINRLDNKSKAILSLSVLGGYSSREIGRIYGMMPSAVRSRLARIKKKLRLELT